MNVKQLIEFLETQDENKEVNIETADSRMDIAGAGITDVAVNFVTSMSDICHCDACDPEVYNFTELDEEEEEEEEGMSLLELLARVMGASSTDERKLYVLSKGGLYFGTWSNVKDKRTATIIDFDNPKLAKIADEQVKNGWTLEELK